MNDLGLVLIQENRRWSYLANRLYDMLTQEEKDRLFELVANKDIDVVLNELYSLSEAPLIKSEVQK